LPLLAAGENRLSFLPGPQRKRWDFPVDISRIKEFAAQASDVEYLEEKSNGVLVPGGGSGESEIVFELSAPDGADLQGVSAGGRFLILNQLGPEKLTAETRKTALRQDPRVAEGSLSWAHSPDGPWTSLWSFAPPTEWLDSEPVERLLLWPEVDREVASLPAATKKVYLRYALQGMSLDDIRLAVFTAAASGPAPLRVSHHWYARGSRMSHSVEISEPEKALEYLININEFSDVENQSIVFECLADRP